MPRPPLAQPARPALVQRTFKSVRVIDAGDTSGSQGALIMLYGNAGVGKTTTAAKVALYPEWAPGVIFDAEAGAKAVAHMVNIIKVRPTKTWLEVSEMVDTIAYAPNPDELVYKLFIFDNMTQIENLCLEHHKATDPRGPQRYAELQHYGRVKVDIIDMVNKLRDAAETKRIIVILNVWQKPELDKETNVTKHEINFIPSLTSSLPGMVDYIGWLTVEGFGMRNLSFAASRDSSAKLRRPNTGNAVKIPLEIKFNINQNPLGDIVNTLLGGNNWPAETYSKK